MRTPDTQVHSITVLALELDFDSKQFEQHWHERNFTNPSIRTLTARVERLWFDETSGVAHPVDTDIKSDLEFYIIGRTDEDTRGKRFFIDAISASDLAMDIGAVIKTSATAYSCDKAGIKRWTPLRIFIDLAAGRGAILSYINKDGIGINLSTPDDLPFNDGILIPMAHRKMVPESESFGNSQPDPDNNP